MRSQKISRILGTLVLLTGCQGYEEQTSQAPAPVAPVAIAAAAAPGGAMSHSRANTQVSGQNFAHAPSNTWHVTQEQAVSTFGLDSDTTSYSMVRKMLREGGMPPVEAVRTEEFVNAFSYKYPEASRSHPLQSQVRVLPAPWNAQHQVMVVGLQTHQIRPAQRPPLNLVLLVDVSGSMDAPDKMPLVQKALGMMLPNLTAQDKISIVTYAGRSDVVLRGTPGDQRHTIEQALNSFQAGGSTAGADGLETAYAVAKENFVPEGINRVVLVTDGDFNVGVSDPAGLEAWVGRQRSSGVYLTTVLVGSQNTMDKTAHALAKAGNGISIFAGDLEDARRGLVEDFGANIVPVANDVKVQVEFNPRTVAQYRLLGYETRLLRREDFNNDQVDAGEIGSNKSITAIYEIVPVGVSTPVTPLRYQTPRSTPRRSADELAIVNIRYKLPNETRSRLLHEQVRQSQAYSSYQSAPSDARFALAVAGFAQSLRDPTSISWSLDDIATAAQGAIGNDQTGRRADFVSLVRLAQSLRR